MSFMYDLAYSVTDPFLENNEKETTMDTNNPYKFPWTIGDINNGATSVLDCTGQTVLVVMDNDAVLQLIENLEMLTSNDDCLKDEYERANNAEIALDRAKNFIVPLQLAMEASSAKIRVLCDAIADLRRELIAEKNS